MFSLHERAKSVFLAALELPADARRSYVSEACGTDTALQREVESLLTFHAQTDGVHPGNISTAHPPDDSIDRSPGAFMSGDVFAGRYRMVTRLGSGGMGAVWRADDLVLETPVALKLIKSRGDSARIQILNEVRLARQITRPAVCRVFDVGEDAGIPLERKSLENGRVAARRDAV